MFGGDISYEMRWNAVKKNLIFVRNAVKCVEIFFHRIRSNYRISYKNAPHSTHFLQKFTQKPRLGKDKHGGEMRGK